MGWPLGRKIIGHCVKRNPKKKNTTYIEKKKGQRKWCPIWQKRNSHPGAEDFLGIVLGRSHFLAPVFSGPPSSFVSDVNLARKGLGGAKTSGNF